jgi:hypothetical protein
MWCRTFRYQMEDIGSSPPLQNTTMHICIDYLAWTACIASCGRSVYDVLAQRSLERRRYTKHFDGKKKKNSHHLSSMYVSSTWSRTNNRSNSLITAILVSKVECVLCSISIILRALYPRQVCSRDSCILFMVL